MSGQLTRLTLWLLKRLARYGPIQTWLRLIAVSFKQEHSVAIAASGLEVVETLPIEIRAACGEQKTRINLLIPALSEHHVFGGIETALQVFDALCSHFDRVRIVVTDEVTTQPNAAAYYGHWPILELDQEPAAAAHIVVAGSRWNKTLAVHQSDYFMATAWWTAHSAFNMLEKQRVLFNLDAPVKLIYLIQDYEPGFYAWSSRFVLAQATYAQPEKTCAIINSTQLAHYLFEQGHHFSHQHVLTPRLHPKLATTRCRSKRFQKKRQLLVYGRPSTERNAFSLIVSALRIWVRDYPAASEWQIVSAGEFFDTINLGGSCLFESVGKVGIDDYARLLTESAVGVSLMISPHPSYPPLEMAAFGVKVVTNCFSSKNLELVSSYVTSINRLNPNNLAQAVANLTQSFDSRPAEQFTVARADIDASWKDDFLNAPIQPQDWTHSVTTALLGSRELLLKTTLS